MKPVAPVFRLRPALAVLMSVLTAPALFAAVSPAEDRAALVNTFIGSKDDGNTFPGASAPFGLIQISPIGSHYSGWRYDDPKIRGFGHSFISGAGCWEQGGQLSVLPVTGSIAPGGDFDTTKAASFDHKKYGADYSHDGEIGQAGYYRVKLTSYGGIVAESTALTRAAAERYRFDSATGDGHVLINPGQANERHWVVGSTIQVVDERTVEGKIVTKSFCGGQQYTTWYRMEFDRPFKAVGTWDEAGGHPGNRAVSMQGDGRPHGAWVTFDLAENQSVTALSAISHVDAEGARRNLRADAYAGTARKTFDSMRGEAQQLWNRELASVRIKGGSKDDRVVFYTSLYHALLQPLTGDDADGRYRGFDQKIHQADGWRWYEYFSLWDTYRSQNQLLALIRPQQARDMATSVLKIHEQSGWLPRWAYANFETNVMTGDPVTPFLVDLWRFGALQGKERQAYQALRQNAFETPAPLSRHDGRAGNTSYVERGFVQYDRAYPAKSMDVDPHHGGSATLEYALADCSLSLMADALGEKADAAILKQRGRNWQNVWDKSARDPQLPFTGFPRPRTDDGQFYVESDGHYNPRSHHGFHEGTAWQYQWLMQQDIRGMTAAMGGKEQTGKRLDAFFAYDALLADPANAARKEWVVGPYSYYNQYRYNPNNEPDLHAPWIYTLIGQPWKTATVLRAAQTLFTNAPNGVTGNDDLGTMSAWYLFSAAGLYPAVPGTGQFLLHTPRFEQLELDLGNGKTLRIEAPGARGDRLQYIRSVRFNGKRHDRVWLDWAELQRGGVLQFTLGDQPDSKGWGTQASSLPASACAAD